VTVVKRAVGAVIVLAALAGLSACTPKPMPLIAVGAADGQVQAMIADCGGDRVKSVILNEVDPGQADPGQAAGSRAPEPSRTLTRDKSGSSRVTNVSIFETSSGWTVENRGVTALDPTRTYSMWALSTGRYIAPVGPFTRADVDRLGKDEVLVGDGYTAPVKVSEKRFRKQAADSC